MDRMTTTWEQTQELFNEANEKLKYPKFGYWLSFVYGVMSRRMTESDLKMFRQHLKRLK